MKTGTIAVETSQSTSKVTPSWDKRIKFISYYFVICRQVNCKKLVRELEVNDLCAKNRVGYLVVKYFRKTEWKLTEFPELFTDNETLSMSWICTLMSVSEQVKVCCRYITHSYWPILDYLNVLHFLALLSWITKHMYPLRTRVHWNKLMDLLQKYL